MDESSCPRKTEEQGPIYAVAPEAGATGASDSSNPSSQSCSQTQQ